MDPETAAAFKRIREADPSNTRCLECGAMDPLWCALSYGAFVCLNCSGQHRQDVLGVHLSFVRSSTMDAWQPHQLKLMEVGGNGKCKSFFEEYGVWDLPFKERYASKAAAYYRSLLRAAADSSLSPPPPLSREEAAEPEAALADNSSSSFDYSSSVPVRALGSQHDAVQQQQEEGLFATLQQQAAAASAAAAAAAATVSSNSGAAIDTALQSVSSFVSGAKEYTAKTLEAAGETAFVEKAKGGFQSGSEWLAQQGKKLSTTWGEGGEGDSSSPRSASGLSSSSSSQHQQDDPQRSGTGMLQSMMSTAKSLTSRSLSNVSQVVRSGSSGAAADGGVFERAREGLSSLTAAATGWLQPTEVPPPAFGGQDGVGPKAEEPEKFL
ncbi:hypothetical protein Efla_001887 [Eimeria flavescens]